MNFYQRVAVVCSRIPRGKVTTYGQIALLCGAPRHARQVGFALKHGLAGPDVPAHRVVNHQGSLSGAPAFSEPDLQQRLLIREGVEVANGPRVNLNKHGWKTSLQDAEELEKQFAALGI